MRIIAFFISVLLLSASACSGFKSMQKGSTGIEIGSQAVKTNPEVKIDKDDKKTKEKK